LAISGERINELAPKLPDPSWSRGFGWYVAAYPTTYEWRGDVRAAALRVLADDQLAGRISINTYVNHPPGWWADARTFDVWTDWGRGGALSTQLRRMVFDFIFNDPEPPFIDWIISGGGMWTPRTGWLNAPPGPAGSDAGHYNHVHVTFI